MSNVSQKAINMSQKEHIEYSLQIGEAAEKLFCELTKEQMCGQEDDINHIDVIFDDGKRVDIKGNKMSTESGYLLIELISVNGSIGWCHKNSKADYIAFRQDNHFILVNKLALWEKTLTLCGLPDFESGDEVTERVFRKNRVVELLGGYENIKYSLFGRVGRNDVFTYIKLNDVLSMEHQIIK